MRMYFALGMFLAFGYLSKPALMPLSAVFIIASCPVRSDLRKAIRCASVVVLGFAIVAGPYITLLSKRQGHLTFSEAGKLAYAWDVNRASYQWVGEPPELGTPLHPRQTLFQQPAAYTFGDTARTQGTYPGWYDSSYWVAGLTPHFNLHQQLSAFKRDTEVLFDLFFSKFYLALLTGLLVLYLFGGNFPASIRALGGYWFLWMPPVAALFTFWCIWIEPRYLGPFVGLFWAGALSGLRLPDTPQSQKLLTSVTAACVFVTSVALLGSTASQIDKVGTAPPLDWHVASALHRAGVKQGERIGAMGRVLKCGWARLARVQIVSEIPHEAEQEFRKANDQVKTDVLDSVFRTGVKVIVADEREEAGCRSGWQPLEKTGFSICFADSGGAVKTANQSEGASTTRGSDRIGAE